MRNRLWAAPFVAVAALFASLATGGCSSADDTAPPAPLNAPGATAYNDDIHCKVDTDCQAAESCTNGLCQMKRCGQSGVVAGAPPLGAHGFMKLDREILVASGSNVIGFNNAASSLTRLTGTSSWAPGGTIVDVAGGNLMHSRPEAFVTASQGSQTLKVTQSNKEVASIPLGFTPIAVSAGDVNGEGFDRIVATAASGQFAICNAMTQTCDAFNLGIGGVRDVALGDVDGDGFDEVLFLIGDKIVLYNHDAGHTTQQRTMTSSTGRNLMRITTGNLNADGFDEVLGLEQGSSNDTIHVLALADGSFTVRTSTDVDSGTVDIAMSGIGRSTKSVIAIGQSNHATVLDAKADDSLAVAYKTTLSSVASITRVALTDIDGDSVPANLIGPAKAASGNLIPIAVLVPPPYSKQYSGEGRGDSRSVVTVGSSATDGTGSDHSVTVSYGYGVSYGTNIGPIFSFNVGGNIQKTMTTTKSVSKSTTVSQSFSFEARPDLDGYETGAVAIACACFNEFDYQIDDPDHQLGKDGADGKVAVFIPIGGQTSVWSLKRYNQLAKALGDGSLPEFAVNIRSGDVSSYPKQAQTIEGNPIDAADMLFPKSPAFRVSDVASTSFALTLADAQTTATNSSSGWTLNVNASLFGVGGNANYGKTDSDGYHVDLANATTFSGSVPPLRDNPSTPEDEFKINSYSFTPVVYAAHYVTPQKKDATYWVVTYTVAR